MADIAPAEVPPSPPPAVPPAQAPLDPPEPPYNTFEPWVKEVKYTDGTQQEYNSMKFSEFHEPKFAMPHNVDCNIKSLTELYLN